MAEDKAPIPFPVEMMDLPARVPAQLGARVMMFAGTVVGHHEGCTDCKHPPNTVTSPDGVIAYLLEHALNCHRPPEVAPLVSVPTWFAIVQERDHQEDRWGGAEHDDAHVPADWLTIMSRLMEEWNERGHPGTGNLAPEQYAKLARQLAAVSLAWLDSMERAGVEIGRTQ